jgi:rRNA biogenesis protein RRP5
LQTLTAAVKSVEDHGYILELGVPQVSGFLSFEDAKLVSGDEKLFVGQLLEVTVIKISSNGRICNVTADPKKFSSSSVGISCILSLP